MSTRSGWHIGFLCTVYVLKSSAKQTNQTYGPLHDKTNKMTCAPSEDSDQPVHLPSLMRIFAVRMKKHGPLNYLLSAQWRLWSEWANAQGWSASSLGAHVILLVLSCGGSYVLVAFLSEQSDWGIKPHKFRIQLSRALRKHVLCHMRTTKVQISLRIHAIWSAPLLFAA